MRAARILAALALFGALLGPLRTAEPATSIVGCKADRGTSYFVPAAPPAVVPLTKVRIDGGACSLPSVTIQVAGVYQVTAWAGWAFNPTGPAQDYRQLGVRLNGACCAPYELQDRAFTAFSTKIVQSVTGVLSLPAGTVLEIEVRQGDPAGVVLDRVGLSVFLV